MAHKYNMDPNGDRIENLIKAQNGTVEELINLLDDHSIALMIRPTGFGKTHLMIDLANREKYEQVLYLYPIDVIKQSIEASYHKRNKQGEIIEPTLEDGIKYAENEEEHKKYPDLPYIEFCTYSKMLEDINNVYRFMGSKSWDKLSKEDKESIEEKWNKLSIDKQEAFKQKWIKDRFEHIELLILDEAHTCGAAGFQSYWHYIHNLTRSKLKSNRLHVLGATATPLRTSGDIDIEESIFYYLYRNNTEKRSARISEFTLQHCWKYKILKRPYYIRGILDMEKEKQKVLQLIASNNSKCDSKSKSEIETELKEAEDKLDDILDVMMPVDKVIYEGVKAVDPEGIKEKSYIRLLVFHADSHDLIENHTKINEAIQSAFVNNECGYTKVNSIYIASNIEELKKAGIEVSSVSAISNRDAEIEEDSTFGDTEIDVIHSIDMLNMGYHVGKVTGIIVRRKTSSEIIYYQQIGRCVSVSANNMPLIIDIANAAAELYSRVSDSQREEASNKIKEFIGGCIQNEIQNNTVDNFYKHMNMCLDNEPLDTELIAYWYYDRKAPIYFIIGICKALGKKDTIESIVKIIYDSGRKRREISNIMLDAQFCRGMIEKDRITKKVISKYIQPQENIFKTLKIKNNSGV